MVAPDTILADRYKIIKRLGRGGMGAVYLAFDQRLAAHVAVKVNLLTLDAASHGGETARKAFTREAKLLANLRHPAFPKVIDYFTQKNAQYLVMEYIPGEDLGRILRTRGTPFSLAEVLAWADVLLDALGNLHQSSNDQHPVIHRDIKPLNLKLTPRGEIFLLDFGAATGSAGLMSTMQSQYNLVVYTSGYSPPEQHMRARHWVETFSATHPAQLSLILSHETSPRSDIYSLGATLHHLITGELPPDAAKRARHLWSRLPDPLRPADELNADIPPSVAAILTKALSFDPDGRFPTAAAMRHALRLCAAELKLSGASSDNDETLLATRYATRAVSQDESQPTFERTASANVVAVRYGTLGKCVSAVRSVAFSPDGKYVASGSNDNVVRLWNTETAQERIMGRCGSGKSGFSYVSSVDFAPDGKAVVSGSDDQTVRLWEVDAEATRILGTTQQPIRSVAFSPDGRHVASGSSDGSVAVWDASTGAVKFAARCVGVVWSLAFSNDGQSLAAESDDKTILIWNIETGELRVIFDSQDNDLRSIAFSPDGSSLAAGGWDYKIRVWDLQTGVMRVLGMCEGAVRGIAFSPDSATLASASNDKTVRLWDLQSDKMSVLGTCDDVVSAIDFSPDGASVATGSWDKTVRLWATRAGLVEQAEDASDR
ncbi:MAG TPA: serine/threonine-protein kinase [Pyrinomonadaceae bacterium]|jgi:WD40 repeat protein